MKRSFRKCLVIGIVSIFSSALSADTRPIEAADQPSHTDVRGDNLRAVSGSAPPADPKLASEPTASKLKITVLIHNYAGVPGVILAKAQRFVHEVFERAGMTIAWHEPLSLAARSDDEKAKTGLRVAIRIVPNRMIGDWAGQHDLLGFSLVPANGKMGFVGGAYYERIEQLARRLGGDTALVLGYVMAHELGHLLLGAHSHAHSGIMSYPLTRKELALASQGQLDFARSEVGRIRARLH